VHTQTPASHSLSLPQLAPHWRGMPQLSSTTPHRNWHVTELGSGVHALASIEPSGVELSGVELSGIELSGIEPSGAESSTGPSREKSPRMLTHAETVAATRASGKRRRP
jgi:hypothetical protein